MGYLIRFVTVLAVVAVAATSPGQDPRADARADLKDREGRTVGRATLEQTPNGVLLTVAFSALPPGPHAFHVHAIGKCEPPFESAGGHLSSKGQHHGFRTPGGPHAGDLPNLFVPDGGRLTVEVLAPGLSLKEGPGAIILDADGAALVVHERPDDHASDPAGNAGARIACGVITGRPA